MSMATDLENWLRKEADDRKCKAASRRHYSTSTMNCSAEDRKIGHMIAEQMMGRKLLKTTRVEDLKNARMEERIAVKLEQEAAMLLRFADFVQSTQEAQ
jgi:hypothetical protein